MTLPRPRRECQRCDHAWPRAFAYCPECGSRLATVWRDLTVTQLRELEARLEAGEYPWPIEPTPVAVTADPGMIGPLTAGDDPPPR